jgi:hypothetical protein
VKAGRLFQRHKNGHHKGPNRNSQKRQLLSRLDSIKGLTVLAIAALFVSGVAIAGEDKILDRNSGHGQNAGAAAAVKTGNSHQGELQFSHDSQTKNTDPKTGPESLGANGTPSGGNIDITAEGNGDIKTTVKEDGTVQHVYEYDDGETKIDVKTKSNSSSSGEVDSDTDIDIRINSNSFSSDSNNDQHERRRSQHRGR